MSVSLSTGAWSYIERIQSATKVIGLKFKIKKNVFQYMIYDIIR